LRALDDTKVQIIFELAKYFFIMGVTQPIAGNIFSGQAVSNTAKFRIDKGVFAGQYRQENNKLHAIIGDNYNNLCNRDVIE
jgi:hypothetical protein